MQQKLKYSVKSKTLMKCTHSSRLSGVGMFLFYIPEKQQKNMYI